MVDATWPSSAAPLGMPVNREFRPGADMAIACDPIESLPVPEGEDPQQFKEQVITRFCGDEQPDGARPVSSRASAAGWATRLKLPIQGSVK